MIIKLHKRLVAFTRGNNGSSLETVITELHNTTSKVINDNKKQQQAISSLTKKSETSLRGLGIIRFNPFKETGGNQSFALALTNERGDGVVISSLYARERLNVFAKPVVRGSSEYTLSNEEQQALSESLNSN